MNDEACGADGDLARSIVIGQADEGDVFRQAGEERGEGVGVGSTERLPIDKTQELRPGTPGGATVRLRAVAKVSEVAAEHEGVDLLHPKQLRGPSVDTAEERVGTMSVKPGEHARNLTVGVKNVVTLAR